MKRTGSRITEVGGGGRRYIFQGHKVFYIRLGGYCRGRIGSRNTGARGGSRGLRYIIWGVCKIYSRLGEEHRKKKNGIINKEWRSKGLRYIFKRRLRITSDKARIVATSTGLVVGIAACLGRSRGWQNPGYVASEVVVCVAARLSRSGVWQSPGYAASGGCDVRRCPFRQERSVAKSLIRRV